jgi:NADPH:quinone reductase-like Zn-dependent oxidoreductase
MATKPDRTDRLDPELREQASAEATPSATTTPTMKAVVRDRYGSTDVLAVQDVERPVAGEGEVLVRVRAAGLDRGAWHVMTGQPYVMRIAGFGLRRPKNRGLGTELAGVIEAVGAGVTGLTPGDAVFGVGTASFAEYTAARPGRLAPAPAKLTFEQAAAVPVSGVTALQALRNHGQVKAGQTVLVIGASGGVGSFAVQLAKAFGATVTGVCSTTKTDLVRSLGADRVIDYTTGDIAAGGHRYDLVLDIGGNRPLAALRRLLNPKGTLVLVGGEGGGRWTGLGRQLRSMMLSPFVGQRLGGPWVAMVNRNDLDTLRSMIEDGALTPAIDRVCLLGALPDAMRDLEAGRVRGKAVTTP